MSQSEEKINSLVKKYEEIANLYDKLGKSDFSNDLKQRLDKVFTNMNTQSMSDEKFKVYENFIVNHESFVESMDKLNKLNREKNNLIQGIQNLDLDIPKHEKIGYEAGLYERIKANHEEDKKKKRDKIDEIQEYINITKEKMEKIEREIKEDEKNLGNSKLSSLGDMLKELLNSLRPPFNNSSPALQDKVSEVKNFIGLNPETEVRNTPPNPNTTDDLSPSQP